MQRAAGGRRARRGRRRRRRRRTVACARVRVRERVPWPRDCHCPAQSDGAREQATSRAWQQQQQQQQQHPTSSVGRERGSLLPVRDGRVVSDCRRRRASACSCSLLSSPPRTRRVSRSACPLAEGRGPLLLSPVHPATSPSPPSLAQRSSAFMVHRAASQPIRGTTAAATTERRSGDDDGDGLASSLAEAARRGRGGEEDTPEARRRRARRGSGRRAQGVGVGGRSRFGPVPCRSRTCRRPPACGSGTAGEGGEAARRARGRRRTRGGGSRRRDRTRWRASARYARASRLCWPRSTATARSSRSAPRSARPRPAGARPCSRRAAAMYAGGGTTAVVKGGARPAGRRRACGDAAAGHARSSRTSQPTFAMYGAALGGSPASAPSSPARPGAGRGPSWPSLAAARRTRRSANRGHRRSGSRCGLGRPEPQEQREADEGMRQLEIAARPQGPLRRSTRASRYPLSAAACPSASAASLVGLLCDGAGERAASPIERNISDAQASLKEGTRDLGKAARLQVRSGCPHRARALA